MRCSRRLISPELTRKTLILSIFLRRELMRSKLSFSLKMRVSLKKMRSEAGVLRRSSSALSGVINTR